MRLLLLAVVLAGCGGKDAADSCEKQHDPATYVATAYFTQVKFQCGVENGARPAPAAEARVCVGCAGHGVDEWSSGADAIRSSDGTFTTTLQLTGGTGTNLLCAPQHCTLPAVTASGPVQATCDDYKSAAEITTIWDAPTWTCN